MPAKATVRHCRQRRAVRSQGDRVEVRSYQSEGQDTAYMVAAAPRGTAATPALFGLIADDFTTRPDRTDRHRVVSVAWMDGSSVQSCFPAGDRAPTKDCWLLSLGVQGALVPA